MQIDRKSKTIRDAAGVRGTFGVDPEHIPDFLALVGDAADGYPGLAGIGAVGAARLVARFGKLEDFPETTLSGERREQALLFKTLATLKTDAPLFKNVDELRWHGPTPDFAERAAEIGDTRLLERARKAPSKRSVHA